MELQTIEWAEVVSLKMAAWIFGVLMLFCGVRLYRLALMLPGALLAGALASDWSRGFAVEVQLGSIVLASIVGGICMLGIERFAISLVGALSGGGLVFFLSPLFNSSHQWHWEWLLLGGIMGALILPLVFSKSLSLVTSALGAMSVCWACEQEGNIGIMTGMTVLGWGVQLYFLRKKRHYD